MVHLQGISALTTLPNGSLGNSLVAKVDLRISILKMGPRTDTDFGSLHQNSVIHPESWVTATTPRFGSQNLRSSLQMTC